MRNKKRAEMLQKANSRVLYLDTREAELMYELLIKTNDIFKELRKTGGSRIDFDEADAIIKKFQGMMLKISDVLDFISERTGADYSEPFLIAKIRNDSQKH